MSTTDQDVDKKKRGIGGQEKGRHPVGRPKGSGSSKLDKHRPQIEALLISGSTQRFIANRLNTTEANLSCRMKKHGLKRKK